MMISKRLKQHISTDESPGDTETMMQRKLKWAIMTCRLCSFAHFFVSTNHLITNYSIMVNNDAHIDSFPSTDPFESAAATNFIPMMQLIGISITTTVSGFISDKVGRKPIILISMSGSTVAGVVQWFCRKSFWPFCLASLFAGLTAGSFPVTLAYTSDVLPSKIEKEKEFSKILGVGILGMGAGVTTAAIVFPLGLFAPLWVGVGLTFITFCVVYQFLLDPEIMKTHHHYDSNVENYDDMLPNKIDKRTMANIVVGLSVDAIGSKVLYPICVTVLAYETFYKDLVSNDKNPIMSLNGYQWLAVFLPLSAIPSALLTPSLFRRIGLAGTCVLGNVFTAVLKIVLLMIANVKPPSEGTFACFVVALYIGIPFTIISQLSTSPMLDRIAPLHRRGFVQGVYTTSYNITAAISQWLLGYLADKTSTNVMIWTGVGISFGAALINALLMLQKRFGPTIKANNNENQGIVSHHDRDDASC